MPQGLL